MTDEGTYIYEYAVKWFGLRIRSIRVSAESETIVWLGPWRWKRERAFDDGVMHAFQIFADSFTKQES